MDKSLNEKYLKRMNTVKDDPNYQSDPELSHKLADDILCDLIEELGYIELIKAFRDMHKL